MLKYKLSTNPTISPSQVRSRSHSSGRLSINHRNNAISFGTQKRRSVRGRSRSFSHSESVEIARVGARKDGSRAEDEDERPSMPAKERFAVPSLSLAPTRGAGGGLAALLTFFAFKGGLLILDAFRLLFLLPFRLTEHVPADGERRREPSGIDLSGKKSTALTRTFLLLGAGCRFLVVVTLVAVRGTVMLLKGLQGAVQAKAEEVIVQPRKKDLEMVTARKALAIKMAEEAAAEVEMASSVREFAVIQTARGDELFTQCWTPLFPQSRGLVVILHGLNEHSGRYNHFAKRLNDSAFKVYGVDWIGHGGSDGLHGYVHSLDHAVDDLKIFLEKVISQNQGLPCFVFGHSTGAAIALKASLDPKIKVLIQGLILTSPAIHVRPSHPLIPVIAPILSLLLPEYQFRAAYKSDSPVSRDPVSLRDKYTDPLVFTGPIRVRTGYEILRISSFLYKNLRRVSVPFLALIGSADTLTIPEATERLYEEASSSDKTLKIYKDLSHDLLFEPERDDVIQDIIDWLSLRINTED
ncbi:monoacylglycerol lipase-like [Zingiber officinale]|uniref:Serine aminopeptidase S33 domain-containing protein n=1 Tax=Zingiber officinale TaxID=94328 RepID=A0A8J5FFA4_ZINOF|nr:monoacylglycerol lipase-like [Zingiber officinale]KAG6486522.1 hypothetical protein ZIOFF_055098 [Zingiber officinale]